MTEQEFASRIRSKHPGSYDDLDDKALTQKVLAKFPQYQDMVQVESPKPGLQTLPPEMGQAVRNDLLNRTLTPMAQSMIPGSKSIPGLGQIVQALSNAGVGFGQGLRRQPDTGVPGSMPASAGYLAGKYGPAAIGAGLAGMVTGPLGAAAVSEPLLGAGGVAALGSAGIAGAGAAGGDLSGMALSKALGGNAPLTMKDAGQEATKTGLFAAASDLGVNMGIRAFVNLFPSMAQVFLKHPAESIKRGIENPDIIPKNGPADKLTVQMRAADKLKGLQDSILATRQATGKAVDTALENLHNATKGEKVFDVTPVVRNTEALIQKAIAEDPTAAAVAASDLNKINKILETMRTVNKPAVTAESAVLDASGRPIMTQVSPAQVVHNELKDARGIVAARRELDKLLEWNPGGVPNISSEVGDRAVREMSNSLRAVIDDTTKSLAKANPAEKAALRGLADANSKFSTVADAYHEVKPMVGTANQGLDALAAKIARLKGKFNKGGIDKKAIEDIGKISPTINTRVQSLMDDLAALSFVELPIGTPSGTIKDMIRFLASPGNVGTAIRVQNALKPAAKAAVPGVGGAIGQAVSEQPK